MYVILLEQGVEPFFVWQTWLGLAVMLVPVIGLHYSLAKLAAGRRGSGFFIVNLLVTPFLQTLFTVWFVMALLPVILGIASWADWFMLLDFWANFPVQALVFVLMAFMISVALSLIPVVNASDHFKYSVLGCYILGLVTRTLMEGAVDVIPGWDVLALLTGLAVGVSVVFRLVVAGLRRLARWAYALADLAGYAAGMYAVFVYGAWLSAQVNFLLR
jgi:hypothetical protein